jgi:tetratricopeptide (TPR) repeat protein
MAKLLFKTLGLLALQFSFNTIVYSQDTFDWGDSPLYAKEKYTQFITLYRQEQYASAKTHLYWLLKNTPKLNPKLYLVASDIYQSLAKKEEDAVYRQVFQDSVLILLDLHENYFGTSPAFLNQKGIVALPYLKNFPEKFPDLFKLYAQIIQENGNDTFAPNLKHYIFLATNLYKKNHRNLSIDKVQDIYKQLSTIVIANRGKDVEYWDKVQNYLDEKFKMIK